MRESTPAGLRLLRQNNLHELFFRQLLVLPDDARFRALVAVAQDLFETVREPRLRFVGRNQVPYVIAGPTEIFLFDAVFREGVHEGILLVHAIEDVAAVSKHIDDARVVGDEHDAVLLLAMRLGAHVRGDRVRNPIWEEPVEPRPLLQHVIQDPVHLLRTEVAPPSCPCSQNPGLRLLRHICPVMVFPLRFTRARDVVPLKHLLRQIEDADVPVADGLRRVEGGEAAA
mmetsp:Transcript_72111/g.202362  ORF Transcript_72111/g.202362 Transcript_72111/m.202362 type:complete len:228 (-) Transcript_72111:990-1673(-)